MGQRLVPGDGTIGILGGGQLGRMMALAARALGLSTVIWEPGGAGPASEAADDLLAEPFVSPLGLEIFAKRVQCVTYEFENVSVEAAQALQKWAPVFPPPELLSVSQHRLREKDRARELGLKTTAYRGVTSPEEAQTAAERLGVPGVLKTVSGGYDGKGQQRVNRPEEAGAAYLRLAPTGSALIYERLVSFSQEISVVVARDQSGTIEPYPVAENHHHQGILDYSIVPARVSDIVAAQALHQARVMAEGLGLVGVMALEYFVTPDDQVLFNEMAPRPHNSGHWTIEAAAPSQFSQHMRAVAGWPIAPVRLLSPVVMVNLLGDLFPAGTLNLPDVLSVEGVQLHWYGKKDMRPGRKVGHLTVLGSSVGEALVRARKAKARLGGVWHDGA